MNEKTNKTRKTPAALDGAVTNRPLRAYLTTLFRVMSWKVALIIALMGCLSLTEGIGVLLLVPLLQLVGLDVRQGGMSQLAEFMSWIVTALGMSPTLIVVLGLYVLIISAHAMLSRLQSIAELGFEQQFVACLRQSLYRAIANANWLFFSRCRASDFTHALTSELERVGTATQCLLLLVANGIVASVYILLALQVSRIPTALIFACGAGLLLLLKGKICSARLTGEELSVATNSLYAATIEHLGGMKTAKSYGTEGRHVEIFSRLAEHVMATNVGGIRNWAAAKCWFDIGSVVVLSLIVYVSIEVVGTPTAGILLLLFLFARIMPRVSSIQQGYQHFVNALPAFATVMELQARCEAAAEPQAEREEKFELRHGIRLERISFGYEGNGKAPVICDLDLNIRAGQTTAIVGPSGAGKSTIADLVMGLIVPDQGRVLIDGVTLGPERMRAWRDQIGYVAQDTFLFHDTVRANLRWACSAAKDGDIHRALSLAGAEEFVSALPQGLDTVLGDRGVLVSGGERQRLALARALLRRPAVLILDEATSSLDSENEKRIQRAIEELHERLTILVITHRLSTIRGADVIHVLEQGRVVESGIWDGLLGNTTGRFRALCRAQGIEVNETDARSCPVGAVRTPALSTGSGSRHR